MISLGFVATLLKNPIFAGMGGAAVLTGLLVWARNIPIKIWRTFQHFFSVQLYVENTDDSYEWINRYLASHPVAKRARTLRLNSIRSSSDRSAYDEEGSPISSRKWVVSTGLGMTVFMEDWTIFVVDRHIQKDGASEVVKESINIRAYSRSQEPIKELVMRAQKLSESQTVLPLYLFRDNYWQTATRKELRSIDTVILADGQKERIMQDIDSFKRSKEFYKERGIPYHRGYSILRPGRNGKDFVDHCYCWSSWNGSSYS
jgi:chaperone BCS1